MDTAEIVNADDVLVRDLAGEEQLLLEAAFDVLRRRPGTVWTSGRMTFNATATPKSASHAW